MRPKARGEPVPHISNHVWICAVLGERGVGDLCQRSERIGEQQPVEAVVACASARATLAIRSWCGSTAAAYAVAVMRAAVYAWLRPGHSQVIASGLGYPSSEVIR